MNNCRIRFICGDYENRLNCEYFERQIEPYVTIGECKYEFNGECISSEAQKDVIKWIRE